MIKLQKDQGSLMQQISDHKAKYGKLAEQLAVEEKKEKDIENKIKEA